MNQRVIRRAATAAMVALLATTVAAFADTTPADGDSVAPGIQNTVDLGQRAPGQVLTWPVGFDLTCDGLFHAAPGQLVWLDFDTATVPTGGSATASRTTIGPVPADWTPNDEGCPFPAPTIPSNASSIVTLGMPTTPGTDYEFTVFWVASGADNLGGTTAMTFVVDVVGNSPPTLALPAGIVAEATTAAGAAVTYTVTAGDAEDAVPPTPVCSPVSGSTFALGNTTVNCTATDSGGLKTSGSFLVTVEDTTPPALQGMPANVSVTTTNQAGVAVTYTNPTATDLVDPAPTVGCSPASGSVFAVGTTTVNCSATDSAQNTATGTFTVTVHLDNPPPPPPPGDTRATWLEPIGGDPAAIVANPGRKIPVKVRLFIDGVEQTEGNAVLSVVACGGGSAVVLPLNWDGGRWNGLLDTSRLAGPGCYQGTATLDDQVAGSFHLDLRGSATAASGKAPVSGAGGATTSGDTASSGDGKTPKKPKTP